MVLLSLKIKFPLNSLTFTDKTAKKKLPATEKTEIFSFCYLLTSHVSWNEIKQPRKISNLSLKDSFSSNFPWHTTKVFSITQKAAERAEKMPKSASALWEELCKGIKYKKFHLSLPLSSSRFSLCLSSRQSNS